MRIVHHLGAAVVTLSLISVPTTPALAQRTEPVFAESAESASIVAGGPAAEAAQTALARAVAAAAKARAEAAAAATEAATLGDAAAAARAAAKAAYARASEAAAAAAVPDVQEFTQNPAEVDDGADEIADDPEPVDGAPLASNASSLAVPVKNLWKSVKKPWAVTHSTGYENFSGSTGTYTKTAAYQTQLSAGATAETEAGIEADAFIGKLSGKVKFTLALNKQKTKSGSQSVTATMSPNRVFQFYAGNRAASGSYNHWEQLPSTGKWTLIWTSKVRSHGMYREGAVKCGSKVPKDTLAYVVNRDYC